MLLYGHTGTTYRTDETPFEYGRTSVFYKAADKTGAAVCVKIFRELDPEDVPKEEMDEFLKEIAIRQQNKLQHPNILPIIDYGVQESYPHHAFLVLPYCAE